MHINIDQYNIKWNNNKKSLRKGEGIRDKNKKFIVNLQFQQHKSRNNK